MMHETLESYEGAVNSQASGIAAVTSNVSSGDYNAAHNAANNVGATQAGIIYSDQFDANGQPTDIRSNTVRTVYSVDDGVKPPVIIQTNP